MRELELRFTEEDNPAMKSLHLVQGGIENGDNTWLEKASRKNLDARGWVVPKSAKPDDEVVIYIRGYGFFATAAISSLPKPRPDWPNRYGAGLTSIKLIEPAIPLETIRGKIPELTWANYPRSITTPIPKIANKVRRLISSRRKGNVSDLGEEALKEASIDELRKVAVLKAKPSATAKERKALYRARSVAIKLYVLARSEGICEGCKKPAPFQKPDGVPYLEPHHTLRLADEGPDDPSHVIALCPNCHRKAHYAMEAKAFNDRLIKALSKLEKG